MRIFTRILNTVILEASKEREKKRDKCEDRGRRKVKQKTLDSSYTVVKLNTARCNYMPTVVDFNLHLYYIHPLHHISAIQLCFFPRARRGIHTRVGIEKFSLHANGLLIPRSPPFRSPSSSTSPPPPFPPLVLISNP